MNFLSYGNRKLPNTTAIFNITSATNCPAETAGECAIADICYAKKTENRWCNTFNYRERQTVLFDSSSARELADAMLINFRMQKQRIKALRFSESGDFRGQNDVNKFSRIAKILKGNNIQVYGYTARKKLDFSELMKYATVNGTNRMLTNKVVIVDQFSDNKRNVKCPADCHICSACAYAKNRIIEIKKH